VTLTDNQKLIQSYEATASIVIKMELDNLWLRLGNENETKKSISLKAIQAINRISPEYLGNLLSENIGNG
jgi:hypothetical protein